MGTCASDCVFYDPELDRERRKFEAKRLRYQMAKHAEQNRASQTLGQALETLRVRGRSPGSPDATPVDEHRRLWLAPQDELVLAPSRSALGFRTRPGGQATMLQARIS